MSKNEFICDCNIIHKDVVENTIKNMPPPTVSEDSSYSSSANTTTIKISPQSITVQDVPIKIA